MNSVNNVCQIICLSSIDTQDSKRERAAAAAAMSSTVTDQVGNGVSSGKPKKRILRKKQVAPKPIKKYIWLAGHGLTLVFGGIYIGFYILKHIISEWYWTPRIAYRLSFIGVLLSYSITVVTTFGLPIPSYHTLLATENFQSLSLALVWLASRPSAFKLFPFYITSLLQIASTYNIGAILKLQKTLGDLIALSEIFVFFALLLDTLLFRGTSGFALVIYIGFYWIRINFSPYTQSYILRYVDFIDNKIIKKQKPEIQAKWQKLKDHVEFRRNQTKKVIESDLAEEPVVDISAKNHVAANKAVGETKNHQVAGTNFGPDQMNKGPFKGYDLKKQQSTTSSLGKSIGLTKTSSEYSNNKDSANTNNVGARLGRAAEEISQSPAKTQVQANKPASTK